MSNENPFFIDVSKYRQGNWYQYFNSVLLSIRSHIKEGVLPNYYDISDADSDCLDCYVDLSHYNPKLCRTIAQEILVIINNKIQL